MKDQNLRYVPKENRDAPFLAAAAVIEPPRLLPDEDLKAILKNGDILASQPFSLYVEQAKKGLVPLSEIANRDQPFNKNNSFIKQFPPFDHKKP
jgi:hypothetical protein